MVISSCNCISWFLCRISEIFGSLWFFHKMLVCLCVSVNVSVCGHKDVTMCAHLIVLAFANYNRIVVTVEIKFIHSWIWNNIIGIIRTLNVLKRKNGQPVLSIIWIASWMCFFDVFFLWIYAFARTYRINGYWPPTATKWQTLVDTLIIKWIDSAIMLPSPSPQQQQKPKINWTKNSRYKIKIAKK